MEAIVRTTTQDDERVSNLVLVSPFESIGVLEVDLVEVE